ncbi:MaoC/PaaZ C-terminal domain-containing protein [Azospirillum agricola]|uniref:MaoC/PaaZ C-terminal domain-containing protein n=1 Tax=Azospirillum agricola TaxID=1720247 RepID=UPI000A0F1A80|nr:MaoC/PaaZ C-terminal domain-containing protein [Azospirillum agricola]SMH38807.1 Acyl dehydratase [Azospirillum lipoferum]
MADDQTGGGLWYEDFVLGRTMRSPARTVMEADIATFAGLTGDFSELHTNEPFARSTPFGGRVAHGLLGLAIAHGLICRTGHIQGTGLASLGWDKWEIRGPIRIGDTVQSVWCAVRLRDSRSRPDAGIVTERIELVNQHGDVVQQGEHTSLIRKRPES